jgi:hypothetical protein
VQSIRLRDLHWSNFMSMRKALAALSMAGALVFLGCDGDVEVHDHYSHHQYYEDRPVQRVYVQADVPPPPPQPVAPPPPPEAVQGDATVDTGDATADVSADVDTGEAAQYFHDDLQPYGDWVVTADFGRCFHPHAVAVGWRPYTLGHWVYTDANGWFWASDESFGWACYHYGRWVVDPRVGWVWVPGRVWAPAWVAWRHGTGVCGWAPLPPASAGISINITIGHIHPDAYCFVDVGHLADPHIHDHFRPVQQNVTIINQTTNITNITNVHGTVINKSVNVTEVERASGRRVEHVKVVDTQTRGPAKVSGDTVQVYRPSLPPPKKKTVPVAESGHTTTHTPAPSHGLQTESVQSDNTGTDTSTHKKAKSSGSTPPPPPSASVDTESDPKSEPKHHAKPPVDSSADSTPASDAPASGSGKPSKPKPHATDNPDSHVTSGKGGTADQTPPPPPPPQGKPDKTKKKPPQQNGDGGDQVQ